MDVINLNKNKIILVDTDKSESNTIDDGCYWVEVTNTNGDNSVSTVATCENGIWFLSGCENPETYQKLITRKLSHKLINPTESIRDEFEKVWVASGEGAEKLIRDKFGCYDDESAFTAYNWFKIGAGIMDV